MNKISRILIKKNTLRVLWSFASFWF